MSIAKCKSLHVKPGPPPSFHDRAVSDRHVPGTKPVWVRNATLWTGNANGTEVVTGDLLLADGLIKAVGIIPDALLRAYPDVESIDARAAWVTPGLVDLHSHMGVGASPKLQGAGDTNSHAAPMQPWLRSIDGLNTHDESFKLGIAGGLTTALILPGSANGIGGQAFVIKLRETEERSPSAMLLEPPFGLNGSQVGADGPPRWRQMKYALPCPRVYSQTRMDTFWQFREAYDKARQIKEAQDEYCEAALAGQWNLVEGKAFPEELQWEALVDVLRGKVKVQTHCYEAVDLDDFVRLSNEFRFPIAAFHHAHESYLVPDVLKRAYDHPPASAIFAAFSRYKREAYRHSEFAARILYDAGLKVVLKSDHSGVVSRYLLHEAQQVHYFGLPENVALASVISTPAEVMGMDHRIGFLRPAYDADVVIWDSHPLQLGATPTQVFVDGAAQLDHPVVTANKDKALQTSPAVPDWADEAASTIGYEGLPPLAPENIKEQAVVFTGVREIITHNGTTVTSAEDLAVIARDGVITCVGIHCAGVTDAAGARIVELEGGALSPGFVTFGTPLGLAEISSDTSTADGPVGEVGAVLPRAVDGLLFGTRDALLAYRHGVTRGVVAPQSSDKLVSGLSVAFSLGALNKVEKGAVTQRIVALHAEVTLKAKESVSTQVARLRALLLDAWRSDTGKQASELIEAAQRVVRGEIPLVVKAHSADVIATLLDLKKDVEAETGRAFSLTIAGGTEAHLIAPELAASGVGVLVLSPRSFPYDWERKRISPGPPLTKDSNVLALVEAGVTVGIGPHGASGPSSWGVRNTRFDVIWLLLESDGRLSKEHALALASTNVEKLLGAKSSGDLVATRSGGLLDFGSKVVGVVSAERGVIDLL
ncbi:uncharacterized protein SCHCODRAFT_02483778 [Schizophyllum commune H4-8]|uniref:Amidohydrolase-related domain-containing protein n=1 Tax=Schizophyllum commune (strain H4-8 / FGSC 9210) TaxID=578458 RepID=D8PU19_SCHCM|nr:uncharacterized protein SCHCODRAFT_02483778 [Schizophyllum commune H4-8]KAI5900749.1 hypothetical protein SCHCODRAFT_02483778 [Schizophyllum commune H4-8]